MIDGIGPVEIGVLVGVIVSICIHEAAHAYTADALGDHTPRFLGRCTLNPIPHIQATPFPTLVLPLITFLFSGGSMVFGGGACPVNVANLRNPRRDDILVSLAGPASNLLLSLLFAVIFIVPGVRDQETMLTLLVLRLGVLNFILFVFNLLPFPPLDGSRVLMAWLPESRRFFDSIVSYGPFIPLLLAVLLLQMFGRQIVAFYLEVVVRLQSLFA